MSKNEYYDAETYYQKSYKYAKESDSLYDKVASSASLGALYGSLLDPTIQQHSNNTGKTARFNPQIWQLNLTQLRQYSPTSTSQPSPTIHKSTPSYSLPRLNTVEKVAVEKSLGRYSNILYYILYHTYYIIYITYYTILYYSDLI